MHMADALISPAVGGTAWAVTAGLIAYSAKKVQTELDERKVPLMGVLGAFVFAAQMINFTIPGTGSSGHLGGGLMLAILLGPYAGFLTMASILTIQALFFGDGGLLALGCNILNMGFYTCFITYPLLYKRLVRSKPSQGRIFWGAMLAAVVGLQLGAFSVVLETLASGISELPFQTFVLLMQPIHLAIGIVEGLITAAVILFVWKARPEIIENAASSRPIGRVSIRRVIVGLIAVTVLTGGILSWFASSHPDGLEWSMFRASGREELTTRERLHESLAKLQEKTALFPDYGWKEPAAAETRPETAAPAWPAVNGGTTAAGLVGALFTLALAGLIGFGLSRFKKQP
jgi:cobalt/nickel transport system permease protein